MESSPSTQKHVYVALMGVTGAGKSTLISHLSKKDVVVGHGIESCTKEIAIHPFEYNKDVTVYLIDTPGFDDSEKTDHTILEELASFLKTSYQESIRLSGIIYLHRITDVRMQGSSMRSLSLFQKLVGENAYKNVVLATNRWEQIDSEVGAKREEQLLTTSRFWGLMRARGCLVQRVMNNKESIMGLIKPFIERNRAPIVLQIQDELVDKGRDLVDTAAGKEAAGQHAEELKKMRKELDEVKAMLRDALKAPEQTSATMIKNESLRIAEVVKNLEVSFQNLGISMEQEMSKRSKRQEAEFERIMENMRRGRESPLLRTYETKPRATATTSASMLGVGTSQWARLDTLNTEFQQLAIETGGELPKLSLYDARKLVLLAKEIFMAQPMLLSIQAPTTIIGDTRGQLVSLLQAFNYFECPGRRRYLLLGNYTGTGKKSLDLLLMCLVFKIKNPQSFYMLRGSLESNPADSLRRMCQERYDMRFYNELTDMFCYLPIAATVGRKVLCVGGAIGRQLQSLDQINNIKRPLQLKPGSIAWDIVNGTFVSPKMQPEGLPTQTPTISASEIKQFCIIHGLKLIVRGRQRVSDGYSYLEGSGDKLVTLWSAPSTWFSSAVLQVKRDLTLQYYVSMFGYTFDQVRDAEQQAV